MKHIAWDNGAIDAAFTSIFGGAIAATTRSKTTKTYCGKRVAGASVGTSNNADCPECLDLYDDEQAALDSLKNTDSRLLREF